MKTVCFVNGSLRGKKTSSSKFLDDIYRLLSSEYVKTSVSVKARPKEGYPAETLKLIGEADAVVLVFPVYTYGLPGALMRLLEDYYRFAREANVPRAGTKVYAVLNCAFPRPEMTSKEAIRVIRNFCRRLSLDWRFAICIGTGPVVAMTRKLPFLDLKLKRAYSRLVSDIAEGGESSVADCFIRPVVPEVVIRKIKEYYEKKGRMRERGHEQS